MSVPATHPSPEGLFEKRRAALLCGLGAAAVVLALVLDTAHEGTSYRAALLLPAATGFALAACSRVAAQRAMSQPARRLVLASLLAETVALGAWLQFLSFERARLPWFIGFSELSNLSDSVSAGDIGVAEASVLVKVRVAQFGTMIVSLAAAAVIMLKVARQAGRSDA